MEDQGYLHIWDVICKEPSICGDGEVNQESEACDDGQANGVVCEPGYDSVCEYCSSTCEITWFGSR